jgi:serine/threonine-protein kinase RsbW
MTAPVQFRIAADLAAVGPAAERVRDLAITAIGQEGGEAVELAFVEAANNVIQHGGLRSGDELDILVTADGAGVTVELQDRGIPMPPDALADAAEPEDLAESGRGLWLIRALADEVAYRSEDGVNRLTLTRRRA